MYKLFSKRIFDFSFSLLGLTILLPVFIFAIFCLYLASRGKPLLLQKRPGKNGKIFRIIKFKTRNDRTDSEGNFLPDADRLTPVGTFVRKTSLDEIPQLVNVLKGDMSLVG